MLCIGFYLIFNCSIFNLPPLSRNNKWQNYKFKIVFTILGSYSSYLLAPTSKAAAPLGDTAARIFVHLWLLIQCFWGTCMYFANFHQIYWWRHVSLQQLHHKNWWCAGLDKRYNSNYFLWQYLSAQQQRLEWFCCLPHFLPFFSLGLCSP